MKAHELVIKLNMYVGKIDTYTKLKLVVYLLPMIKIELKKVDGIYEEKFSMLYLSRIYDELVKDDEIIEYIRRIESHLKFPVGIVSTELKYLLHDLGSQPIRPIFKFLSEAELSENELVYFYKEFLDEMLDLMGGKYKLLKTQESIVDLKKLLLQIEPGMSIYDGFCGLGDVVSIADNRNRIYMQEQDMTVTAMAAVNAMLHDCTPEIIQSGDSYCCPLSNIGFDRIVSFPPMNLKLMQDYLYKACDVNRIPPELATSDTIPIVQAVELLNYNGIAIIQVPLSFLFKGGKTLRFREWMIRDKYIDCVIELPSGAVKNTGVATALIVLKKDNTAEDILLINPSELWQKNSRDGGNFTVDAVEHIYSIYERRVETEFSALIKRNTIVENECKLTLQTYRKTEIKIDIPDISALTLRESELAQQMVLISDELREHRRKHTSV